MRYMLLTPRRALFPLAAFLFLAAAAPAQAPPAGKLTTVIFIRHAERGPDEGFSSPIIAKGRQRARKLAHVLASSGITRIFVSEYVRTRQTVEPLARDLNIEPVEVAQKNGIDQLAARLTATVRENPGQTILVCSHRGRVEALIEKLGGEKITPLADPDYDSLFILTIPDSGPPKLLTLKY